MKKARAPPGGAARAGGTLRRAVVMVLFAACVALVVMPAAAFATPTLTGSFTGSDTPAGNLGMTDSSRIAVDESTGDVYVIDATHDAVDKFDANGTYISQIAGGSTSAGTFNFGGNGYDDIAVDNSGGAGQGDVYVLAFNSNTLFSFDSSGSERWLPPALGDGLWCGMGVDQSGFPWEADASTSDLTQLSPADGSPTGRTISTSSNYCHMAFDNDGAVYATNLNSGFDKYDGRGGTISIDPTPVVTYAAAASRQRNEIFSVVLDRGIPAIRQWDKNGTLISRIDGSSSGDSYKGVAFNGATDTLYVSDVTTGEVQIYSVPPQPPTVTPAASSNLTPTSGTVNGSVNPNGSDVTDCHVDYETDAQFTTDGGTFVTFSSVPCAQALPLTGVADVDVSADLTGLTPGTTYHTRIVATNAGGTTNGNDTLLLTEPPVPPTVVTGAASSIGETGATLAGTVNPNGSNVTDCHIDYGTSTSYGSAVPCSPSPGSGSSAVAVSGAVTGLSAGTTYHFRVVATNAGGTTNGDDATFTTATPPDRCVVDPASCQPPPQRCPTTLSLCHPHLHLNGGGSWVGSNWFLRVKCSDDLGGTCAGTLTLKATIKVKVKKGHKTVVKKKTITVGTASYSVTVGGTARLKVKLTSAAKSALKKGALTATVTSSTDGKIGTVRISKIKTKAKHKHKRK